MATLRYCLAPSCPCLTVADNVLEFAGRAASRKDYPASVIQSPHSPTYRG
ncbi:Uncharacterised protein [Vibrio cholerae]|nr:Uncharacterised protein [Vibrio cholerae]CSC82870.1 Uncharacterised protein [Vibrio cholerae]